MSQDVSWRLVMDQLSLRDVLSLEQTCRYFYNLLSQDLEKERRIAVYILRHVIGIDNIAPILKGMNEGRSFYYWCNEAGRDQECGVSLLDALRAFDKETSPYFLSDLDESIQTLWERQQHPPSEEHCLKCDASAWDGVFRYCQDHMKMQLEKSLLFRFAMFRYHNRLLGEWTTGEVNEDFEELQSWQPMNFIFGIYTDGPGGFFAYCLFQSNDFETSEDLDY